MAEPHQSRPPEETDDQQNTGETVREAHLRLVHLRAQSSRWSWATRGLHLAELGLAIAAALYGMTIGAIAASNAHVQVADITIGAIINVIIVMAVLSTIAITGRDAIRGLVEKIGQDTPEWVTHSNHKIGFALASALAMYTIGREHWETWSWLSAIMIALVVIFGTQMAIVKKVYDTQSSDVRNDNEEPQGVFPAARGQNGK